MPAKLSASPAFVGDDLPATKGDLQAVFNTLRQVQEMVRRLEMPVSVLPTDMACDALKCSRSGLAKIDARRVFSDARPRECRTKGRQRLYYADEIQAYLLGGRRAVRELREAAGRI